MREYMFKQLGQIVSIIKQHTRDCMEEISVIRVRGRGRGVGEREGEREKREG